MRPHLTDYELLLLIEGEPTPAHAARLRAHVETCDRCRGQYDALVRALHAGLEALRTEPATTREAHDAARAALQARLAVAVASREMGRAAQSHGSRAIRWTAAAAILLLATAAVIALARVVNRPVETRVEYDALPMPHVTPGATAEVTLAQVCSGRTPEPEPADPSVRQQVLTAYGMAHVPEHEYELDYLITPALGGANDPRNLWPERYSNRRWNAKVKDQLEDLLPGLVCEGKVDLQTAQRDIAADWVEAYKKYFKTQVPLGSS